MKAFGAKRHSRHNFFDRSRHWNGDQATAWGVRDIESMPIEDED
jgi:hypothetical protein